MSGGTNQQPDMDNCLASFYDFAIGAAHGQTLVELPSGLWVVRAGALSAKALVR